MKKKSSFLISAASFTLNLLPRAKRQHGICENVCAPQKMRLQPIHLAPPSCSPPYPSQRGLGGDVLVPQTGALLLSLVFLTFIIYFFNHPFNPLHSAPPSLVFVSSYGPFCRHFSVSLFHRRFYFDPSCSEAILLLLSGAFFIVVFHPPFFSLISSRRRPRLILIFTNSAGVSEQSDQIWEG